jgi:RNA polymerase sigma-54 factor
MNIEQGLGQRLEQRLQLSQQVLQSLELLQLPILELEQVVSQELSENPALELADELEEHESPSETQSDTASPTEERMDILDEIDAELARGERATPDQQAEEARTDMLQNIESRPANLQDYLYRQWSLMDLPKDVQSLGEHIIYNIDDNGYLKYSIEDIASSISPQFPDVSQEELKDRLTLVLETIQKLDPKGVGARDTVECLLLQLSEADPNYGLKRRIIVECLEDLSKNRLPEIAKRLDVSLEQVKEIVAEFSHMRLRPGAILSPQKAPAISPDAVVKKIDDMYEIVIEDSYLPRLGISRTYQQMLSDPGLTKQEKEFIREKITSARKLMTAIEYRRGTLYRIINEVVKHQHDFLENGIEHLKPLTMQQVASTLGLSVSTISRAVADKYIDTPQGIFNLKFFFASPLELDSSEQHSRRTLISKLDEIISGEDKKRPLTDSQIVDLLKRQGIRVSRRTIGKVRDECNIPPAQLRKQY